MNLYLNNFWLSEELLMRHHIAFLIQFKKRIISKFPIVVFYVSNVTTIATPKYFFRLFNYFYSFMPEFIKRFVYLFFIIKIYCKCKFFKPLPILWHTSI